MAPFAGYLRMSEKSKRMSSKGKEMFRFVPFSSTGVQEKYKHFHSSKTNILVASGAASDRKKAKLHTQDSTLADLYVLVDIVEEECKGDEWIARVVEMLGECTDLSSCAQVLAHNRALMDGNQPLDKRTQKGTANDKSKNTTVTKTAVAKPATVFDLSRLSANLSDESSMSSRTDLRSADNKKDGQFNVFSVDPPGCVDIDDAVHIRPFSPEECAALQPLVAQYMGAVDTNVIVMYEMGVHIADVTNYIKQFCTDAAAGAQNSTVSTSTTEPAAAAVPSVAEKIVREALHRSFTVYLPHQQIPILPQYLSHDECSLHAGEDRFTLTCFLTVALNTATPAGSAPPPTPAPAAASSVSGESNLPPQGKDNFTVLAYRFEKTLIRSVGAFTYDQIDQFLDNQSAAASAAASAAGTVAGVKCSSTSTVAKSGKAAGKCAPQTASPAAGAGTSNAVAPTKALPSSVKYSLKLFRKLFPTRDSHELVEQLMLLANTCAADFLESRMVQAFAGASTDSASPNAYLLRRQLPASFTAARQSAEKSSGDDGTTAAILSAIDFTGVPVELTANAAEYIYCPVSRAHTTIPGADGAVTFTSGADSQLHVLSAVEKAHVSLGVKLYTHFTSPIRRYADQIVHALMSRLMEPQASCHSAASTLKAPSDTSTAAAMEGYRADPWLNNFSPATVAYVNLKQKQHKKFQRDMTILEFVFDQCAAAGANEVTLTAEAVVLPFRFSDKHRAYKTDLYVLSPCKFVYPLRLHTAAQAQLFDISYTSTALTLRSRQTKEEKILHVGQRISVQVHCSKSAASMRKKCVLSSASITF